MKTSDLIGPALDWAVAKAWQSVYSDNHLIKHARGFYPSTDWAHGGPIIEREWLDVTPWPNESDEGLRWQCAQHDTGNVAFGPTPLIAAMRCYVASKLGDEITLPGALNV